MQDLSLVFVDSLLWRAGVSLVVACGLSCPAARGILVPQPGIEPESPALEGRFFTTGPPGKSPDHTFSSKNVRRPGFPHGCASALHIGLAE